MTDPKKVYVYDGDAAEWIEIAQGFASGGGGGGTGTAGWPQLFMTMGA